jgi:prepilin-type N-terminal cleavage/methylation domain-containing protein
MLTGTSRGGFTLVEIMLATVVMLIISGSIYQVFLATVRLTRAQASRFSIQSTTRGALLAVTAELRELSNPDLLSVAPAALTYRAMRGTGFTCISSLSNRIQIDRAGFSGHRDPQPGRDSALIYLDPGRPGTTPAWTPVAITGAAPATCPAGLGPGMAVNVSPTDLLAGAPAGTPVRIYETMELRLYQSEGQSWLGMRSISAGETVQPLFGPLHENRGFQLQYLDASGAVTSIPAAIASALVTVHGLGEGSVSGLLTAQVALRNARP